MISMKPHYNYGGILQCWALQHTLHKLGHQPELIHIRDKFNLSKDEKFRIPLSSIKNFIKRYLFGHKEINWQLPWHPEYRFGHQYYLDTDFVDTHIKHTSNIYNDRQLYKVLKHENYDAFVVGSDQVWREIYVPNIFHNFLDFLAPEDHRPRISYAASFGTSEDYISVESLPRCIELLQKFDTVSVREVQGVDIVRNTFHRQQVEAVLDPTLLVNREVYESCISPKDRNPNNKLLAYILDSNDEKEKILGEVSVSLELEPIVVSSDDVANAKTISQWLAMFADAEFVVTDSFHGMVFSIIFQKPFIVIPNLGRGVDRFTSLLGQLNLTGRMIGDLESFHTNKETLLHKPDYASINETLTSLKERSIRFLKESLDLSSHSSR